MGYVSNQWLNRGRGVRQRPYKPVPVAMECERPTDSWSIQNFVLAKFRVTDDEGQVQTLHMSKSEVDAAAEVFFTCASPELQQRFLLESVRELTNAKLLRLLALDLVSVSGSLAVSANRFTRTHRNLRG